MTRSPDHLPFPADLQRFTLSGVADSLSAIEIGTAYRLLRAAWDQPDPCTLPADDTFLAMVAGITDEEFARSKPRVLLTLACRSLPDRRYLFEVARRVYDEQADIADRRRRQTAAATNAAALKKRGRSTTDNPSRIRYGSTTDPSGQNAPSYLSSTPALHRSSLSANQSAQSGEDVIAVMGDGARAILKDKIAEWKRSECLRMMQAAFSQWIASRITNIPMQKASELASGRWAEPARVEWLIEDANNKIAAAKAKGERSNPIGVLMHGLGESKASRGRAVDIPLFHAEKWEKKIAAQLKIADAQAAILALQHKARTAIAEPQRQPKTS